MNKKMLTMGVSVTLGGLLLATTAFAGLSGSSGYDTYKTALLTTMTAESVTSQIEVTVKDNGSILDTAQVAFKMDITNKSMSGNVNIANESIDIYNQTGQFVIKNSNSDVYKVMETKNEWDQNEYSDGNMMMDSDHVKRMESVVDALSTGFQNYITTSNNIDGSKEVEINLTGSQVPAVFNAMASVAVTNMDMERGTKYAENMPLGIDIPNQMPKLVSDITIEDISVNAQIGQDNLLTGQTQTIVITGLDAYGVQHEVEVTVKMAFTNYNNTTTENVDITGKQVQIIESMERMHR